MCLISDNKDRFYDNQICLLQDLYKNEALKNTLS